MDGWWMDEGRWMEPAAMAHRKFNWPNSCNKPNSEAFIEPPEPGMNLDGIALEERPIDLKTNLLYLCNSPATEILNFEIQIFNLISFASRSLADSLGSSRVLIQLTPFKSLQQTAKDKLKKKIEISEINSGTRHLVCRVLLKKQIFN